MRPRVWKGRHWDLVKQVLQYHPLVKFNHLLLGMYPPVLEVAVGEDFNMEISFSKAFASILMNHNGDWDLGLVSVQEIWNISTYMECRRKLLSCRVCYFGNDLKCWILTVFKWSLEVGTLLFTFDKGKIFYSNFKNSISCLKFTWTAIIHPHSGAMLPLI